MPSGRAYLDHNATSPLRPEAWAAMLAALETLGNPSSVHAEGRAARALLETARAKIAAGLGTAPGTLVFTSGATEAANLVLTPALQTAPGAPPFDALLVSAGEHAAALQGHRFPSGAVETIPLTSAGEMSRSALAEALRRRSGQKIMLALQAANNETGVVQPVREAADMVHAADGVLVSDATQAIGRVEADFAATGADALYFSSHKLGGPMGAGVLAFARDAYHIDQPLLRGGGQESGRRAGTENLAAVVGFAAAFEAAVASMEGERERLAALRDETERAVRRAAPDAVFVGRDAMRLANTCAFQIPGLAAHTLLMALDLDGVAVSSGSACSSGKVRESHVLSAMGLEQKTALRASLGWSSGPEDVKQFGMVLAKAVGRMRKASNA
jgi:cysteine desulfurase